MKLGHDKKDTTKKHIDKYIFDWKPGEKLSDRVKRGGIFSDIAFFITFMILAIAGLAKTNLSLSLAVAAVALILVYFIFGRV